MKPKIFKTFDDVRLAFFPIKAVNAKAVVVFLHCGGGHINQEYIDMGQEIAEMGISVYLLDLRGHGQSEGNRGDTPDAEAIYKDLERFLEFVHLEHPVESLFVAGHSISCTLWINFLNSSYAQRIAIKGIYFIAPNFGEATEREFEEDPFIEKADKLPWLIYKFSKGLFFKHRYIVFLRYLPEMLQRDPLLVTAYTSEMIKALLLQNPSRDIEKMNIPFYIIVGKEDQLVHHRKLDRFCKKIPYYKGMSAVPMLKHLQIIIKVPEIIGKTLSLIS